MGEILDELLNEAHWGSPVAEPPIHFADEQRRSRYLWGLIGNRHIALFGYPGTLVRNVHVAESLPPFHPLELASFLVDEIYEGGLDELRRLTETHPMARHGAFTEDEAAFETEAAEATANPAYRGVGAGILVPGPSDVMPRQGQVVSRRRQIFLKSYVSQHLIGLHAHEIDESGNADAFHDPGIPANRGKKPPHTGNLVVRSGLVVGETYKGTGKVPKGVRRLWKLAAAQMISPALDEGGHVPVQREPDPTER
jgi:hypothetical protein